MAKKGYKQTKEHVEKCRQSKIGKPRVDMFGNTFGFKKGGKPWNYGLTKEIDERLLNACEKQSKVHKGKKLSEDHKQKIGKAGKGKKRTDVTKARLSLCKRGEKNPAWNNGSSQDKYDYDFTDELKERIRKRDKYCCRECHAQQGKLKYKLPVHHIDYVKQNNDENNLILLCKSCHSKTNFDRDDWIKYFKNKI